MKVRTDPNAPWRELRYALWFPLYLLSYHLAERLVTSHYWATQLPVDREIPFCVYAIVPYSLWYPLLIGVGAYLLLRDRHGFRRYMAFLALTFFLSVAIWLLIPNGQNLRPLLLHQDDVFSRVVRFLHRIDTNTNVFPSVHVVGSVAAAWAAWECQRLRGRLWCWIVTALAAVICVSTLLVKQHTVLDVAGGIVLAAAVGALVYRRPAAHASPLLRRREAEI